MIADEDDRILIKLGDEKIIDFDLMQDRKDVVFSQIITGLEKLGFEFDHQFMD